MNLFLRALSIVIASSLAVHIVSCTSSDEVASENRETFLIAKLDTDRNRQAVQKYRIEAIPTFIVFKDGKITGRFVGGMQKAALVQRILQAINVQGN